MKNKSFEGYLLAVNSEPYNKHLRYGQVLFNVLMRYDAELAEIIRATKFDPFYADKASPLTAIFLTCVETHYGF